MATYSMQSHSLEFSSDYNTLIVKSGSATVQTYELTGSSTVKLMVASGSYDISYDTCGSCFTEPFNLGTLLNPIQIAAAKMDIGISDIRDLDRMVNQFFTYHLDACPVWLHYVSDTDFQVTSPCGNPCSAPNADCRDLVEEEV